MDVTLADEDVYSTFVEVAANVEVGDNFNFDLWQLDNSLTKYFHDKVTDPVWCNLP